MRQHRRSNESLSNIIISHLLHFSTPCIKKGINVSTRAIIEQLSISSEFEKDINEFLNIVSFYKIAPYVNFLKENSDTYDYIKKQTGVKNKWEAIIYLFRYNVKLSLSLYPYIFLLETVLKTRINSKLTEQYTDYWFRDELLLLKINQIDTMNDLSLYNKYKKQELTRDKANSLKEDLELVNDQLKELGKEYIGTTKITSKLKHIKRCCYLYLETQNALTMNPRTTCVEFVENHTTLGYWLSILSTSFLWENDAKLMEIFPNLPTNFPKKEVMKKLENIRLLRNKIAHHCRIIGCNQIKENVSLKSIFDDIKQIFEFLGVDCDSQFDISELECNGSYNCTKRSFEILYKELELLHDKEIKAKIPNFETAKIEMVDINSSYCKKIGYSSKERILQVEFNGGEVYQYFKVPIFLYEKLCKSESKGKFFIKNIKENYNYKRIV